MSGKSILIHSLFAHSRDLGTTTATIELMFWEWASHLWCKLGRLVRMIMIEQYRSTTPYPAHHEVNKPKLSWYYITLDPGSQRPMLYPVLLLIETSQISHFRTYSSQASGLRAKYQNEHRALLEVQKSRSWLEFCELQEADKTTVVSRAAVPDSAVQMSDVWKAMAKTNLAAAQQITSVSTAVIHRYDDIRNRWWTTARPRLTFPEDGWHPIHLSRTITKQNYAWRANVVDQTLPPMPTYVCIYATFIRSSSLPASLYTYVLARGREESHPACINRWAKIKNQNRHLERRCERMSNGK